MSVKLTFAQEYHDITCVYLGNVEIGRILDRGGKQSWIFHLGPKGKGWCIEWKDERSLLACKNAIIAEVADWMRMAGVAQL